MKFSKQLIACAVAAGLAAPMSAFATNGYFAHGYSAKSQALGGGASALPQDAMIAADNPAGMVKVGERMDLGLALFSPSPRGYKVTGAPTTTPPAGFPMEPGDFESDNDFFIIPHFAYNWMLNADSSVGVTVYGNGGMNTEYPASMYAYPSPLPQGSGTYYAGTAGVNLEQLFANVSYSRKINDKHSWGVSAILAYQRFEAKGLAAFGAFGFSSDPSNLTDNGTDNSTGYGAKIGWLGEVSPGLTLAASYQTKMTMSEFDKYKGLFAEQGGFDIPATWTLGLAWKIASTGTLTFDVQGIQYSDVASIANPMLPNLATAQLGNDNGAGFGWEDIVVYKLGYQWETSPQWTWRVGGSIGDNPIPSSEVLFNILAPGIMETHITGGFTYNMGPSNEFTMAAMYAPESTVSGTNPLDPNQQVELNMTQWQLTASWGWKF
ncbi:MAG: outer membrane protein transport protein [Thiohalomonadales bacterium]|nr:outer membrane protein transport protein [Thiohalomonadales bacterium]